MVSGTQDHPSKVKYIARRNDVSMVFFLWQNSMMQTVEWLASMLRKDDGSSDTVLQELHNGNPHCITVNNGTR